MDRDFAVVEPVDPAAVAEPHLESRGNRQQPPGAVDLDQDSEAACPCNIVGVPRDRKELVERGVAYRELSGEDAMHPRRRAQYVACGKHGLAASKQCAVAARDAPLFPAEHDMAVERPIRSEEGEGPPVHPLLMPPFM